MVVFQVLGKVDCGHAALAELALEAITGRLHEERRQLSRTLYLERATIQSAIPFTLHLPSGRPDCRVYLCLPRRTGKTP
jgi:hypothetical protein